MYTGGVCLFLGGLEGTEVGDYLGRRVDVVELDDDGRGDKLEEVDEDNCCKRLKRVGNGHRF